MNWANIEKLLAKCTKPPSASQTSRYSGLADYGDVLSRYDGTEGFVGETQYLMLWKMDQIAELNGAYQVPELLGGITLIGTDGGDTGFGIDQASKRYVAVPIVGMSRSAVRDAGGTFEEFLEGLAEL